MSYMEFASTGGMPAPASCSVLPSFSALETAILLFASCPAKAKAFALSMFERAAWELDVDQIEHWARIVTQLGKIAMILQV
jgi:hypothetical protein